MSKYRKFEIIADKINHMEKRLTINQTISLTILESQVIKDPKELHDIYFATCKLEYLRFSSLYTQQLGEELYVLLCNIFNEKTKYQQIMDLDCFLNRFFISSGRRLTPMDYQRTLSVVSGYYRIEQSLLSEIVTKKLTPPPVVKTEIIPPPPAKKHPRRKLYRFRRVRRFLRRRFPRQ